MTRPCPACGATAARHFLTAEARTPSGEPYRVVTCDACSLRYTRPLPTLPELTTLYGDEFYGRQKRSLLSWDTLRGVLHQDVLWQRRQALLGRRIGRILDIGCGDGDFLASLRRRGWEVYGTEFSAAAGERTRARGITVHQGDLASARFPDGFFDVVTLWHVLEHLPEPLADLAETRRVLRDDGLLVLEVPNSASLTLRLCRERWFALDVPRHLQHFTGATLRDLLGQAGFAPIRTRNFHHVDFVLSFVSFMHRLAVLGRPSGMHYFVHDFREASLGAKVLFLATGGLTLLLSLPYSLVSTMMTGNGETMTVTALKGAPAALPDRQPVMRAS